MPQVMLLSAKTHRNEEIIAALQQRNFSVRCQVVDSAVSIIESDDLIICIAKRYREAHEMVRTIRSQGSTLPLIVLLDTGYNWKVATKLIDAGADDALDAWTHRELIAARAGSMLRRKAPTAHVVEIDAIHINVRSKCVHINGVHIKLTLCEYLFIECLAKSPGRFVSWGQIDAYIHRSISVRELCRKDRNRLSVFFFRIRKAGFDPYIECESDVGYRLRSARKAPASPASH